MFSNNFFTNYLLFFLFVLTIVNVHIIKVAFMNSNEFHNDRQGSRLYFTDRKPDSNPRKVIFFQTIKLFNRLHNICNAYNNRIKTHTVLNFQHFLQAFGIKYITQSSVYSQHNVLIELLVSVRTQVRKFKIHLLRFIKTLFVWKAILGTRAGKKDVKGHYK